MDGSLALYKMSVVGIAIDNLLVAHHGLRDALNADHLPFDASFTAAIERYGNTPMLHLWNECRLVEALRVAWIDAWSEERQKVEA